MTVNAQAYAGALERTSKKDLLIILKVNKSARDMNDSNPVHALHHKLLINELIKRSVASGDSNQPN
jgi:hypothetical protein